jgi:hypothetical protein
MRRLVMLLAAVVVLLGARPSRAGDIDIRALDGTPWTRLVQQIQDEVASQGRVFPVLVVDGDTPVHCGEYELRLDAVTATAFQVEACDPATDATALRLVRREALFEPGDVVPRARKASIDAAITRRGRVEGGGAPPQAGSKVWCTVALQPYLWDALRGEPTPLLPDRFVVVAVEDDMTEPTAQKTQTTFRQDCTVRCAIHAPPARIWSLLTDAAGFARWNSTVVSLTGTIAVGEKLAIKAKVAPERTFTPKVTRLVPEQEMEWSDGFAPMFKGVRTFALAPQAGGVTEFTMTEVFSGAMLPMIRGSLPDFGPPFETFARDLKKAAEGGA